MHLNPQKWLNSDSNAFASPKPYFSYFFEKVISLDPALPEDKLPQKAPLKASLNELELTLKLRR